MNKRKLRNFALTSLCFGLLTLALGIIVQPTQFSILIGSGILLGIGIKSIKKYINHG